jgi:hypothetical protein
MEFPMIEQVWAHSVSLAGDEIQMPTLDVSCAWGSLILYRYHNIDPRLKTYEQPNFR